MIRSAARLATAVVLILTAAVSVPHADAQSAPGPLHLLNVPYLPQSEALCGGAAVAMVMRYWGQGGVYAESFASLVDPTAGGIRGEDLLSALHARGWQAVSFRGDPLLVQSHLDKDRPVIALIQDRPGRFHYVVVVGWAGGRVIVHDPARAPFRVLDEKAFNDAWSQSGYWTMVATRSAPPAAGSDAAAVRTDGDPRPAPPSPCAAMVAEGVRLAGAADIEAAKRLLEVAAQSCPTSADPWRELAGLHALRNEWREAASDARRALSHAADDPLAARILATALYLDGDPDAALEAWNLVREPVIDLVKVTGLERTRYMAAARTLGLEPQMLLTRPALDAARRRLAELPSAQATRIAYRPGENGRAEVEAVVLERPRLPASPVMLAGIGVRALTDRELVVGVASPSGGGEMWTVGWRWWDRRPRVAVGFAAPSPVGGLWGVDMFDERQSYAGPDGTIEEGRRRASFHLSDWTRAGFRWEGTAGVDSFDHVDGSRTGRALALAFSGEQRLAADRASVAATAGAWLGTVRTWTLGVSAEWRTTPRNQGRVWIGRAGADIAAPSAPLALWPGAGTGPGRDVLLRAHSLLDHGVVAGSLFGPRLTHGGVEWRRWMPRAKLVRVAPAIFLDLAGASGGLVRFNRRWQSDLGAGLRIAVPGSGVVRIDLARGLRDGETALSVGWTR